MSPKTTKKTHDKIMFSVEKRDLLGKKVKKIRAEGKVPGNVYGKDMASIAIQFDAKIFGKILHEAGLTQVVYVEVEKKEIPALIQNVQYDPVTDVFIHVDFKKVNLLQKTEAHVPILIVGESEAIAQNKGDLLTLENSLTVEALPTDMPQEVEIDISDLKEIDDEIKVSDLKPAGKYVFIDEPGMVIVRIAEHKEESLEPETTAPAVEGEGEGAAEGGEGAPTKEEAKAEAPAEPEVKEGN